MHDTLAHVVTDDQSARRDPEPTPPSQPASRAATTPAIPSQRPGTRAARRDPWRLHVLGPVELSYEGQPVEVTGVARALLALLARTPGREVSTSSMVVSIWGSSAPEDAESVIASNISRLRKALTVVAPDVDPTSIVVTMPSGYILVIGEANVDSETFERFLADGRRALGVGQPALAKARLDAALAMWRGKAYEDYGDHVFTRTEAERLEELRLAAIECTVDARLAMAAPDVPDGLLEEVQELVSDHWHRERMWGQLMVVLYRLGRRGDALAAFRQAHHQLVDALTVEPGAALRAIEKAVLANDPDLYGHPITRSSVPAAIATTEPACVGRDEEVEWLLAGLDLAATRRGQARLIVGSPGLGKTRLLGEVAHRAAERGIAIHYGQAEDLSRTLTTAADRLTLVLIDDIDLAAHDELQRVIDFVRSTRERAALTLLTCRDPVRVGELSTLPKLMLGSLGDVAIADIVRVYAPSTTTATAVAAMVNTGGVPAKVHRAASEWAFARAGRRIDRAAAAVTKPRQLLAGARDEVMAGVMELDFVREQARPLRPASRQRRSNPYKGLAAYEVGDAELLHGRDRAVAELVASLVGTQMLTLIGPRASGKSSLLRAGLLPALTAGVLSDSARWRQLVLTPATTGSLAWRLAQPAPEEPVDQAQTVDDELTESAATSDVAVPNGIEEIPASNGSLSWAGPTTLAPQVMESRPVWATSATGTTVQIVRPDSATGTEPGSSTLTDVAAPSESTTTEPATVESATAEPATADQAEQQLPPHTLVLMDQFEEAYTILSDEERWHLYDEIIDAVRSGSVTVLLAVRSEFYPDLAEHGELSQLVTANTVLIEPMSDEELRQVIVEPAALTGVTVDASLVDELVADAPRAGLAALSLMLHRLWNGRSGRTITLSSYRSTSGVGVAIPAAGEAAFLALANDRERRAAAVILTGLAARSGEILVGRAVPREDLLEEAGADGPAALRMLLQHGIVTLTDDVIEIAHEELLISWPRLRGWLDDDKAQRELRNHLSRAATVWVNSGTRPDDLYVGARLAAALDFAATYPQETTAVEREFLAASQRILFAEQTRQRRRVTALWRWLVAVTMTLVAAIAAGILVLIAWQGATQDNLRADAAAVGAQALSEPDVRRALLLSLAASRLDPAATDVVRQTLLRTPGLVAAVGEDVTAIAVSPDGMIVAAGGRDGSIWLTGAGGLAHPVRLNGPGQTPVAGVAFTHDGRLVSWGGDSTDDSASILVWDLGSRTSGEPFGQPWPSSGGLLVDGATLAVVQNIGGPTGTLVAWNIDARTPSTAYDLPSPALGTVLVSADGTTLAFGTPTGTTALDLTSATSKSMPSLRRPAALSPHGGQLLALNGHDVEVWDTATGRRLSVAKGPKSDVVAAAWDAAGESFAAADSTGSVYIWNAKTFAVVRVVDADGTPIRAIAFAHNGETLYTASVSGLLAWDLTGTRGVAASAGTADAATLTALACGLAGRELTPEEWDRYLPRQPYRHVCPS